MAKAKAKVQEEKLRSFDVYYQLHEGPAVEQRVHNHLMAARYFNHEARETDIVITLAGNALNAIWHHFYFRASWDNQTLLHEMDSWWYPWAQAASNGFHLEDCPFRDYLVVPNLDVGEQLLKQGLQPDLPCVRFYRPDMDQFRLVMTIPYPFRSMLILEDQLSLYFNVLWRRESP